MSDGKSKPGESKPGERLGKWFCPFEQIKSKQTGVQQIASNSSPCLGLARVRVLSFLELRALIDQVFLFKSEELFADCKSKLLGSASAF